MQKPITLLCQHNKEVNHLLLSKEEWLVLEEICKHLKHFQVLSNLLSGDKYVTISYVIIGFNMLVDKLDKEILELSKKVSNSVSDCTINKQILSALQAARDKLFKHYNKSNWIYCAALILDPRHKTEMFKKTPWGREMYAHSFEVFKTLYMTNYYVPQEEVIKF